jgi:hypothetical protein
MGTQPMHNEDILAPVRPRLSAAVVLAFPITVFHRLRARDERLEPQIRTKMK